MHQKDTVNDDDFEPYLSNQTNQVGFFSAFGISIAKIVSFAICLIGIIKMHAATWNIVQE